MNRHPEHSAEPSEDRLDREIRRALAGLPREGADAGFTTAVLRRLEEPRRHRAGGGFFRPGVGWRLPLAAALAGGALAAVLVLAGAWPALVGSPTAPVPVTEGEAADAGSAREQAREARALLERLRREHRSLERDLAYLPASTAGEGGVIYLDGDDDLDLVLNLGQPAAGLGPGTVRPAALQGRGEPRFE